MPSHRGNLAKQPQFHPLWPCKGFANAASHSPPHAELEKTVRSLRMPAEVLLAPQYCRDWGFANHLRYLKIRMTLDSINQGLHPRRPFSVAMTLRLRQLRWVSQAQGSERLRGLWLCSLGVCLIQCEALIPSVGQEMCPHCSLVRS